MALPGPSTSQYGKSKSRHSSLFGSSFRQENDTVKEKHQMLSTHPHRHSSSASGLTQYILPPSMAQHFVAVPVALPFIQGRRILVPLPRILVQTFRPQPHINNRPLSRVPKSRAKLFGTVAFIILSLIILITKIRTGRNLPRMPFTEPDTLILEPMDVARLWAYEISAGRYPSRKGVPSSVQFRAQDLHDITNAGLPADMNIRAFSKHPSSSNRANDNHQFRPSGPKRRYLDLPQPKIHDVDVASPSSGRSLSSPYPPRPVPRSAIDLDVVMEHCDFQLHRYVRDCLEVLRVGAGLDPGKRVRRGASKRWQHLFRDETEEVSNHSPKSPAPQKYDDVYHPADILESLGFGSTKDNTFLVQQANADDRLLPRADHGHPPSRRKVGAGPHRSAHPTHITADPTCDPDFPRIFHIFWAGPFTDKPYLAVLSFLFTQNLGLQFDMPEVPHAFNEPLNKQRSDREAFLTETCRPQMWIWINPGPAASVPDPAARSRMFSQLAANPWSAPFLDRRFEEVVKFKLWNTTEQLDGVPELRDSWRNQPLFNSGGVKFGGGPKEASRDDVLVEEAVDVEVKLEDADLEPANKREEIQNDEEHGRFGDVEVGEEAIAKDRLAPHPTARIANASESGGDTQRPAPSPTKASGEDELYERVGSTSSKGYDRLSVVLSDMARFVLCHRFGGIYLDADTILLRDWEELWGWHGAFAYRWSRLEKYNTAVLKLQRNSAIGSFLFKTALANGLDFHPMTISRYTKDAAVEGLLLRLPDALFDPAWLNTEYYQRDRPPFPYMKRFEDFFDPPSEASAGPMAVGFEGFFKGAFSYHFHNFWWIPFDPARNWPDLGPRFVEGERAARVKLLEAKILSELDANKTNTAEAALPPKVVQHVTPETIDIDHDVYEDDERDLGWATVLKRTFEAYIRGERPNMYGEYIRF